MSLTDYKLSFQELQELQKNWNCTHIDVTPFRFDWKLENFSSMFYKSNLYCPYSDTIKSEFGETDWCMNLLFNSNNRYLDLSLNVSPTQNKEHKVGIKCWFYILNKYQAKYMSEHAKLQEINAELGILLDQFIDFYTLEKWDLFVDDTLSIVCEGCIADGDVNIFFKIHELHLSDDFANLLEDGKFSDATIIVSKREFKVHKAILASRSPIFEAMFSHDMEETKTGKVVVDDIEEDVFEELLRFVYTGKTLNLEKMSVQLFVAADKYALEQLKLMCQKDLCNRLSVENAALLLELADTFNAKYLKAKVLYFLSNNKMEVMKTNAWNSLMKSRPEVIAKALQKILTKNL